MEINDCFKGAAEFLQGGRNKWKNLVLNLNLNLSIGRQKHLRISRL